MAKGGFGNMQQIMQQAQRMQQQMEQAKQRLEEMTPVDRALLLHTLGALTALLRLAGPEGERGMS